MRRKEWAIHFLIQIKEKDEVYFVKHMFEEILSLPDNNKLGFAICIKIDRDLVESFFNKNLATSANPVGKYTTFFCDILLDTKTKKRNLNILNNDESFDIKNEIALTNFFTYFRKINGIAKKNSLITWNHGYGYAIFKEPIKKSGGVIIGDRYSIDYDALTGTKLKAVLKKVFQPKKLDVLAMINCNINLFDFGYVLRDTVKYLVAPESNIELSGYNYKKIFFTLNKQPDISEKKLAALFVNSYRNKEYSHSILALKKEATINKAIFCNNLIFYGRYAVLLDSLALHLTHLLVSPENLISLQKTRAKTDEVPGSTHSLMIDMHAFFYYLKEEFTSDSKIQKLYRVANILIQRIVIAKYSSTEKINRINSRIQLLNGFSICFPKDKNVSIEDMFYLDYIKDNSEFCTLFSKNHIWDNFLEAFYEKEPSLLFD